MSNTIGAKLKLDGEKEFRTAIKDIDGELKMLGSALDLTSTKFANQKESVEALTQRQKDLQAIYDKQGDKVSTLKKRLEEATALYGESDKRITAMKTALNKAEQAQEKTRQEIEKTTEALKKHSEGADKAGQEISEFAEDSADAQGNLTGFGDVIGGLANKLGINLPEGATKALNGLGGLNAGALATVGAIAGVTAVLVGLESKLIDIAREGAQFADNILTQSVVTGISTKKLQEYTYCAELMDVSVETLTGSQTKLIRNMKSAQDGTQKQIDAFAKLGVAFEDTNGNLRDSEEVFWDSIEALGNMANETERDAVAMDLFGKSAQDLNPLIEAGRKTMEEYAQQANDVGFVLDDIALNKLGELDNSFQIVDRSVETLKKRVAEEFAPYLTEFLDGLPEKIDGLADMLEDSHLIDLFGDLLGLVEALSPALKILGDVTSIITPAIDSLRLVIGVLGDTISTVLDGLSQLLDLGGGDIRSFWDIGAETFSNGMTSDVIKSVNNADYNEKYGEIYRQQIANIVPQRTPYDPTYGFTPVENNTFNFNVKADEIGDVQAMVNKAKNQQRVTRMYDERS